MMNHSIRYLALLIISLLLSFSCSRQKDTSAAAKMESIEILRGELALCGAPEFGKVNFGLTCTDEIQADFNLAIALLHSFEYKEAEKAFARVIDADPQCAVAYWGVAMSNLHELWAPPTKAESEKCSKILEIARSLPTKSEKEADYIDAISLYFENWENEDHQSRANRYSERMKELYLKYPDDKEAAVFYALALNGTSDPADKSYAKQREAGELLNSLFPDQPDHPGIAHYLIHNYDYPELAELGLDAAKRYAAIAPASAHAQHMPSHIFTRLGLWNESISSNLRSVDAAVCYFENMEITGNSPQELHALDYLMYAYLQQAEDDKANELMAYVNSISSSDAENFAAAYAFAAIPCRLALERRHWSEAAKVELLPDAFKWEMYPWERSIVHFSRALGSVRAGDPGSAQAELDILRANKEELILKEDVYKSNQVEIQVKAIEAWIAFADGQDKKALKLMRSSADMEDATGKHPVTPGEVLPARELLADMMMEMGMHEEALVEYSVSLERAPQRYNSLYGAGLAAEKLGLTEEANSFYRKLLELTIDKDDKRPSEEHAEAYLSAIQS